MTHEYAKSSLISKISFGFVVPNYATEVIQTFAPTHERTYTSIQSTIELLKVTITLLLNCEADADHIAVLVKILEQKAFQRNANENRGILKFVDTPDSEDSGSLLREILNDTGDLVNNAHDDINRVSLILKRARFKLDRVGMYASAFAVKSANDPRDMSTFNRQCLLSSSDVFH